MGLYNPTFETTPNAPSAGSVIYPKADGLWYFRSVGGNETPVGLISDSSLIFGVPQWIKVGNGLLYSAFSAAALTQSITLFSLVAGGIIHAVKVKHSTSFTGPAIASVMARVGIGGTTDKYSSDFDVMQAVPSIPWISQAWGVESDSAATNILITLTSTGANLSVLTQGVLNVWALLSKTSP